MKQILNEQKGVTLIVSKAKVASWNLVSQTVAKTASESMYKE